jgi:hypothetical protein
VSLIDYRPIRLTQIFTNLVAKKNLVATTLGMRLIPRLGKLVEKNQCVFIQMGRILDNFMLVQQNVCCLKLGDAHDGHHTRVGLSFLGTPI